MQLFKAAGACLAAILIGAAAPIAAPVAALAQGAAPTTPRDGAHDFDFNLGVWRTHIRRVTNPFDGGDKIVTFEGTVTVRSVWGGRGELEEIETDGFEGMTVFLYDPAGHQWSQSFIGAKAGVLNKPTIGSFENGVGRLYASDTYQDRSILVRGEWSNITADAHDYVESYSRDGGQTWTPVFIAHLTRLQS